VVGADLCVGGYMCESNEAFVELIHRAPRKFVLTMSGGGGCALAQLLAVPGASRTVLEAVVPYSSEAMVSFLGGRPDQFCSARTARAMAMVAFRRAALLDATSVDQVAGFACTASLATDRPKLGEHRAHFAVQTSTQTAFWSLPLEKDARTRHAEEQLVSAMALNILAETSGIGERISLELRPSESIESARAEAPPRLRDLFLGSTEAICEGRSAAKPGSAGRRVIFPGEFNPLHVGHRRMAEVAEEILELPVEFEVSITNVEKPPLDYYEIDRRIKQFRPEQSLWLTRAPRFVDKCRLFPGATFVVGIDTLRRIASPRYYGNDAALFDSAINAITGRGNRFLVFGRNLGTGFVGLRDLDIPQKLIDICREVGPQQFREDISSTAIRRAGDW